MGWTDGGREDPGNVKEGRRVLRKEVAEEFRLRKSNEDNVESPRKESLRKELVRRISSGTGFSDKHCSQPK